MDRMSLKLNIQNSTVTIKKGKQDLGFDNNVTRGYNCMEKVHKYYINQTKNISIEIRHFSSRFTVQNSNGSAPNKHSPM